MSYIEENLMPNEKIVFSALIHPAVALPAIGMFIASIAILIYALTITGKIGTQPEMITKFLLLVACLFFIYSIILGLQALILMLATEFAVTNRRIIAKTGFIRRRTIEILLSKVESVAIDQNILGRLMNYGNVTITGTGGTKETFNAIAEPIAVRSKINQIIERYTQAGSQSQAQNEVDPKWEG